MEKVRLVGEPIDVQNNYKYYKSFAYIKNGIYRSYSVGECFFSKNGEDPLVGEIMQIFEKNNETKEVRVGFYVLPDKSTHGPKADSGEHEVYASEYDATIPLGAIPELIHEEIELERSLIAVGPTEVPDDPVVPDETEGEVITGDVINKGRNLQCQKIKVISYKDYNRYRTMLRRLDYKTQDWLTDKTAIALGLISVTGQQVHFLFCRYYCSCPNLPFQNGKEPLISNFQEKYKKLNTSPQPKSHVFNRRAQYSIIRRVNGMKAVARNDEQIFLQRLFKFMKNQNTPIHRVPSLGFRQIDLFRFYKKVQRYGGYDQITNKRLWKNIYDSMGGDPGSTSAATCTRKHYERIQRNNSTLRGICRFSEHIHGIHMPIVLLLPFERHLSDDSIPEVHSSILQEANIDNIQVSEPAAVIPDYKSLYGNEDIQAKPNKIILENKKSEKNPPSGELSILKNMLGFNGKVETENFENKRSAGLKIKLEKMPKQEHGKMKEFWQKKAIVPNEMPNTNSKPDKEDRWNEIRKKNVLARSWGRIQKTPKPIIIKQEPCDETPTRNIDSLSYQNEIQKKMLFNLMEFRNHAHVNEKQRYNAVSSSVLPSEYNISHESPNVSVVQERSVDPKTEIVKSELQSSLEDEDTNDDPLCAVKSYCPFRSSSEKTSDSQTETSNENAAAGNSSDTPPDDTELKGEANASNPSTTDANDPASLKLEDPNLPHLYVTNNNNKAGQKIKVHDSDQNEKVFAENQNPPLCTPADEINKNIKFPDPLLHQRPSVILHTEQIRSPPPIIPPVASKVTNGVIANSIISRQTLISQKCEQFVNSLKLQQPQVENKIITKQFYDPITKQLHDLPIVEPMVSKSKLTSNTPCAKKKGTNSKKSFDSGYGHSDPCDKIRNTLWKSNNNARKNVSQHSSSNKAVKRKKSASNHNNSAKSTPVLSVPFVEPKKLKLSMPVIHSSPFISSLSKSANFTFKLAPYIHRNPKSSGSNEPMDLSVRSIGRGRNRRLPTNSISDIIGLDLSLKKGSSSSHTSSISCGIENITPPPVTALRDTSLFSNGLDYIPSAVRKKFQQAFLETKALSIPHNKGPQSSTPVSQMPSTSLNFISRNHPLYSVPISSNSSRYPVHSTDNDPCFKPNAYMSPLWPPPSYETKASIPQLAPHVDTKPFSFNHLPPQLYPYVNSERQCCNEQQYFVPHSK